MTECQPKTADLKFITVREAVEDWLTIAPDHRTDSELRKRLFGVDEPVQWQWQFDENNWTPAEPPSVAELQEYPGRFRPLYLAPRVPEPQRFQQRVLDWLMACFSMQVCRDGTERNHRFLEEALELVQSLGCTRSEAHQLVDYVYGRPVGEPTQELGGVMVTLAALCFPHDLDMQEAAEAELARVWTKIEAIRAKQAAKPKHSPLPQAEAVKSHSGRYPESAIEATERKVRARLANNGRNPDNNNQGIRVGSDLHLMEMLLGEIDRLRDFTKSSDGGSRQQPFAPADAVGETPAPRADSGKQEGRSGSEVGASQTSASSMSFGVEKPITAGAAPGPSDAVGTIRAAVVEECAKFVEQHQERITETERGSERSLAPRTIGNLAGVAYVDGIRALACQPVTDCPMKGTEQ